MALLKAGTRLKSAVCSTELMVVAAPADEIEVTCGGAPLIGIKDDAPAGYSAAFEVPETFVEEVRSCFRKLR